MQRLFITLIVLLYWTTNYIYAQDKHLPQTYSFILGGGLTLPHVDGNKNDFFSKNGNRAGYVLMAEGRYYFMPHLALGLQYDYLRIADLPDKMHLHYVHPNITYRHLWSDGNQGVFLSLGIGYMNYQERTYRQRQRKGYLFQRGYCGISLGVGYEFRIIKELSGILRADILTTDWFVNPDARLFNPTPDEYDDTNHNFFKNDITFLNLGFALQFGR